jgi:hypothetical protein
MRLSEARQVFGDGRIRTPEEQARFVPQAAKPIVPEQPTPADLSFEDFDLWSELSRRQCEELALLASARKMTPVQFVVDLLIRTKAITKAKRGVGAVAAESRPAA